MKSTRLKNILTVIGVALFVLLVAITFLPKVVEWRVKDHFQGKLGAAIDYENVQWSGSGFIFSNFKVKSNDKEAASFSLTADQLRVGYIFKPFDRCLKLDIALEKPHLKIFQNRSEISPVTFFKKKFKKLSKPSLLFSIKKDEKMHLIHTNIQFALGNGIVELIAPSGVPKLTLDINGSGSFGSLKEMKNAFKVDLGGKSLELTYDEKGSDNLILEFQKFDCSNIYAVYSFFSEPGSKSWEIEKGSLSGTFKSLNDHQDHPYLEGDGFLSNLVAEHTLSGIGLTIDELKITAKEALNNSIASDSLLDRLIHNTTAEVSLSKAASLYRFRENLPNWLLRNILGSAVWNAKDRNFLDFDVNGSFFFNEDQAVAFSLTGAIPENLQNNRAEGSFKLESGGDKPASAHLEVTKGYNNSELFDLSLENISPREYETVRNLWPELSFVWEEAQFLKGLISLHVKANREKDKSISLINVEEIDGRNLWFSVRDLEIEGRVAQISGNMDFAFRGDEKYLKPGSGKLSLTDGDFYWGSKASYKEEEEDDDLGRLKGLNCSLALKDGILESGNLTGNLSGMQTELNFYGASAPVTLSLQIQGKLNKIASLLPDSWTQKIKQKLPEDEMTFAGELRHDGQDLQFVGQLNLQDPIGNPSTLDFTAYLERVSKQVMDHSSVKWRRWGISLMEKKDSSLIPLLRPLSQHILKINWLKDFSGSWGMVLKQGIVKSEHFSLSRYLTPLVLEDATSQLEGVARLHGDFNDRSLLLHFDVRDFLLDNKDLIIKMPLIGQYGKDALKASSDKSNDPASFVYIDFQEGNSYGYATVKGGSYFDKDKHLVFTDVNTFVSLSKSKLQLSQISTISDGVTFKGELDIDFTSKDAFDLSAYAHEVVGDVKSVQVFGSHIGDLALWHWPLSGHLESEKSGVSLDAKIFYDDRKTLLNWKLQGKLTDGNFESAKYTSTLNNINCSFAYDSTSKFLEVTDGTSNLLVGSGQNQDFYRVELPLFQIYSQESIVTNFDLIVNQDNDEFIHIVGEGHPFGAPGEKLTELSFAQNQTHIGNLYPRVQKLVLKDLSDIITLKATPRITLDGILGDLEKFSKANVLPLSLNSWLKKDLQGSIRANVDIEENNFLITATGSNVSVDDKKDIDISLRAEGVENQWKLDSLKIGSFSLAADLEKNSDQIVIQQVRADDFGLSLLGDGLYNFQDKTLKLNIKESTVLIADLKATRNFKLISQLWKPSGKITFSGLLEMSLAGINKESSISLSGKAALENVEIRGKKIENQGAIFVNYKTGAGLKVEGLSLNIQGAMDQQYHGNFNLQKASYDFERDTIHLEKLGFTLSSTYLRELVHLGKDFFPDSIDDRTAIFLQDIKREGGLQGYVTIEISPSDVKFRARLASGKYILSGNEINLKNVTILYGSSQLQLEGQYQLGDLPLQVVMQVERPSMDKGVITVTEVSSAPSGSALNGYWELDQNNHFVVKKVEGMAAGIAINLQELQGGNYLSNQLVGQIQLQDITKVKSCLSPKARQLLEKWGIGNGYTLKGQFDISKSDYKNIAFHGSLEAKNFTLLDFELSALKADVNFGPGKLVMTHFNITDKDAKVSMPQLMAIKDIQNNWTLSIPMVQVKEFKPDHFSKKSSKAIKNFVIHEAQLRDFSAVLGYTQTFRGTGFLQFEKIEKNTLGNVLLAIPADILGRIGLSTSVMNPVVGQINYSIHDSRIYITKLKDVYSEGERSKFLLAKAPATSYIDFDGNLNLYLRLKHYNLLLKLAESLRVHITGKWSNPNVSFEKNSTPIQN